MWLVARSSERNLCAIQQALPEHTYRPVRIERRRTRGHRAFTSHTLQQYPGYAFVHQRAEDLLRALQPRHSHSLLRTTQGEVALVPDDQLEYARELERMGIYARRHGYPAGTLVEITTGPLAGLRGEVVSSERAGVRLCLPASPLPLLVATSQLRVLAAPA